MTHSIPDDAPAGQVQTRPDGSKVYTHSLRVPDNTRTVTQEYGPDGHLRSAHVVWSGFAGQVLDVTATFDASGKLVEEQGYRAPDLTTPVSDLIRPLPASVQAQPAPDHAAPVSVPRLGASDGGSQAQPDAPQSPDHPDRQG